MLRVVAFVCLLLCATTGCQQKTKPLVGVVPKGANHIFWQTVHAGAIKASQEFDFDVLWNAPTLEVDASRQIEIVDSMVNRGLDGLVLAPVDRVALVRVVDRAVQKGIPVSIFDSALDSEKPISYVATDNEEGGRMAARRMGEILGGRGAVGIIGFMPGSASTMEREHGFQDELGTKFPGIRIVGIQFGMADRAKAMAVTENLLTAHPNLDGLFADNESSTAGAVQALKSRANRKAKLVAFDASDQLINDLKDGWIDSLVIQNPFLMGYEATKAIGLKLRGEQPPAKVDSGAALVTRDNLEDPHIQELLFPDIQRYLKGAPAAH